MHKENNDHEIDHLKKQFYRNPLDPDVTEGKAIANTAKILFKVLFIFILPAIIVLYSLYYFIGW